VASAAAVTDSADAEPAAPARSQPLRTLRWVGYAVLAVQLVCFMAWSTAIYHDFALSIDYQIYHQAWYLIAHGHLNPGNFGFNPFWQDHSEFVMWPLALFYWIPPHDLMLLWLQDAGVVVAEAVAFTWICELADKHRPARDAVWLAGTGLILLVANPWTWWSVSFDFHTETISIAFLLLLARDLANGRRRAWVWAAALLACGDVAATYLVGIGLSGVLAGRRSRLPGAVMVGLGAAFLEISKIVNGDVSTPLWAYSYLQANPTAPFSVGGLAKGVASHPGRVVSALWSKRQFIWRNLASSGPLGLGFVWALPLAVIVLLTNNLANDGNLFARPSFQSLPLYILLPVGTVAVLAWLARRQVFVALLLAGLVVAQAAVLTAEWGPKTKEQFLVVPPATAATLSSVLSRIPSSDEVITSTFISGRFSGRRDVQALFEPGLRIPLDGTTTWFVIVPASESLSPSQTQEIINELQGPMHARRVTQANGVWAYRWTPPRRQASYTVP
jgi:hypothetical protein